MGSSPKAPPPQSGQDSAAAGLRPSALSSFLMISKSSQSWYVGSSTKSQTSGESSFSFCKGNQWMEVSLKVSRYRG